MAFSCIAGYGGLPPPLRSQRANIFSDIAVCGISNHQPSLRRRVGMMVRISSSTLRLCGVEGRGDVVYVCVMDWLYRLCVQS